MKLIHKTPSYLCPWSRKPIRAVKLLALSLHARPCASGALHSVHPKNRLGRTVRLGEPRDKATVDLAFLMAYATAGRAVAPVVGQPAWPAVVDEVLA